MGNHSKKEYVYLKDYYELNNDVKHNRCMHPLALLASIGNDENSGGNYPLWFTSEENSKLVGSWALDHISIEKQKDDFISAKYNELAPRFPLLFDN